MKTEIHDDFADLDAALDGPALATAVTAAINLSLSTDGVSAKSLAAAPASLPPRVRNRKIPGRPVYIDLETIPDYERIGQFGLPELPTEIPPTPLTSCPSQPHLVALPVEQVVAHMSQINPPDEWLCGLEAAERVGKSRKGVLEAIGKVRSLREAGGKVALAEAERRKLLSVTPEYCKVAAIGWAIGDGEPDAAVLGEGGRIESHLVDIFWQLATKFSPIVLFNGLHFDIPVIFIRSFLLGIEPTKRLDLRPWGTDVIDLFKIRWPRDSGMKLKILARTMGIDVPAGDDDGSMVEEAMNAGDYPRVRRYVTSDVVIAREVHRMYSGYFCP